MGNKQRSETTKREAKKTRPASVSVGNRRLLALAKLLMRLPAERFNFNHVVSERWGGAQDISCGTTACALGWAATMPALRRQGLRILRHQRGNGVGVSLTPDLSYDMSSERYAARVLFAVTYDDFERLFVPHDGPACYRTHPAQLGSKATPRDVARNIRAFVKERSR